MFYLLFSLLFLPSMLEDFYHDKISCQTSYYTREGRKTFFSTLHFWAPHYLSFALGGWGEMPGEDVCITKTLNSRDAQAHWHLWNRWKGGTGLQEFWKFELFAIWKDCKKSISSDAISNWRNSSIFFTCRKNYAL